MEFLKINLFKKSFRNTIRVSNSLDPDQARHFVQSVCKGYQQMTSPLAGKELINNKCSDKTVQLCRMIWICTVCISSKTPFHLSWPKYPHNPKNCDRLGWAKQCRTRLDAAECGIWSGSTLFVTHPAVFKKHQQVVKWFFKRLDKTESPIFILLCVLCFKRQPFRL